MSRLFICGVRIFDVIGMDFYVGDVLVEGNWIKWVL